MRATTEVVANHNHCHAMTIQYFEVLRHLRVTHELADVQECLFVPLPMTPFDRAKALRWRQSLETYLQRPELAAGLRRRPPRRRPTGPRSTTRSGATPTRRCTRISGRIDADDHHSAAAAARAAAARPGRTRTTRRRPIGRRAQPDRRVPRRAAGHRDRWRVADRGRGHDGGRSTPPRRRSTGRARARRGPVAQAIAAGALRALPQRRHAGRRGRLRRPARALRADRRRASSSGSAGADFTLVSDYQPGMPLLVVRARPTSAPARAARSQPARRQVRRRHCRRAAARS